MRRLVKRLNLAAKSIRDRSIGYNAGRGKKRRSLPGQRDQSLIVMTEPVKQLVIHGVTRQDQRFRPSDWAERLAGVMSQFRPAGAAGGHLTYSPYVVPRLIDGVRCVVVDARLRELEPLAWKFVCGFADDNNLKTSGIDPTDMSKPQS